MKNAHEHTHHASYLYFENLTTLRFVRHFTSLYSSYTQIEVNWCDWLFNYLKYLLFKVVAHTHKGILVSGSVHFNNWNFEIRFLIWILFLPKTKIAFLWNKILIPKYKWLQRTATSNFLFILADKAEKKVNYSIRLRVQNIMVFSILQKTPKSQHFNGFGQNVAYNYNYQHNYHFEPV